MSGKNTDAKAPFFKSEEEMWAYIEEQEEILNRLEDIFAKVKKKQSVHDGIADLPAPVSEIERLALEGDVIAQYNLSIALSKGEGVARNPEWAAFWLLKAAEGGFAPAQYNIGCYWLDAKDPQRAFEWFMKAAKQNFGPAQFNLGILYGNAGDYALAYIWFYLAEQNQVVEARDYRKKAATCLSKDELNDARVAVSALMFDLQQ